MACQEYMFIEGWNSFSSYVSPEIANLDDLFMTQMNEMIVLRNLSSMYWPAQGVNTLGNLDNNSGYVMKVSADNTLDFCGIHSNTNAIELAEGWNYLPVPCAYNVSAMELFSGNMDDILLVQELIGTQVFWPETGIYSLETLEPGKAYAIQVENPFTLTFPNCGGDGQNSSQSTQMNTIETPWGEIMMTPSTQVIALLETATAGLQAGDAVGVFGENDEIYGYAEIGEGGMAKTITLFGDDETTSMQDGFMDGEYLTYKLYRPGTAETFPMDVEYDYNFGNTSGMFEAGTYSAINNIVLTITGIDDAEGINFGMYPNPATDVLNITSNGSENSNYSVEIIDATGNVVSQNSFFGNSSIDLSAIPSGFYFVKMSSEIFNQTRKLIIK